MDINERWTRGAGSGIGASNHNNEYRPGVLISNFVEDNVKAEFAKTGKHLLGFGEPMQATTTYAASFAPEGKTGDDLLLVSERQDQQLGKKGMPGDLLTRHGNFAGPRDSFYATLNQLTYTPKQLGDPRMDTFIWNGRNYHDAGIPQSTTSTSGLDLTSTKRQQWDQDEAIDPYATTTRSTLHAAAVPSAENPSKMQTTLPIADSGHLSQIGRKPRGQHADECDKTYRRIGLRDNWYKP